MKIIKKVLLGSKTIDFVLLDLNKKEEMDAYYKLFVDCFGERSNVQQETFEWFNLKAPLYNNLLFSFINNDESRLMCAYGLLPVDVTLSASIYKCALCTNVMTHPDYEGIGLFHMIGKESLEYIKSIGISFAFGVPNDKAIRGHLKAGWEVVNELYFYEIILKESSNIQNSKRVKTDNTSEIFDGLYNTLFSDKYQFYFNRTNKWMKWRLNKPLSNYTTFSISESEVFAYVIVKSYYEKQTDIKKIHIVDFGYSDVSLFDELIQHTLHFAKQEGCNLLNLWQYSFNTTEVNILKSLGFNETKNVNPVIIHKLGNQIDLPQKNWHVTLFDNDVY